MVPTDRHSLAPSSFSQQSLLAQLRHNLFQDLKTIEGANYIGYRGDFAVLKHGHKIADLQPEKRIFVVQGIRMTETVNEEEVSRLARAMTWKNALAELPFGGAKSGITVDSKKISREEKDEIVKWFSKSLKIVIPELYIAGPDMYMAEGEMETFALNKSSHLC